MHYIYSTLTASTVYAKYAPSGNRDIPVIERKVMINGGANIADKHMVTPKGVVTQVTDEELALLENDYHFQEHVKHGFITVEKKHAAVEKVVKNLTEKDKSAPLTPEDPEFQPEARGAKLATSSQRKK